MRLTPLSLLAAFALPQLSHAQALPEIIAIQAENGPIIATLTLPAGDPAPVVLLLHGFTGARDELKTEHVPEGVFARTALRLSEAGYASLRIDFRGSGDSTTRMAFADTTFEGQVSDALAAMAFLEASDSVAGDDIFVIGWSQGGLVAAASAGRSNTPDAIALWNAVAEPMATYGAIFGAETLDAAIAAEADETVPLTLPWGAEVALKGAFFDQVAGFEPAPELAGFDGGLMVIRGASDTLVDPASADAFLNAHEGPDADWTGDMDHVFNVMATDDTLEAVIDQTIAFFDAQAN
ncbi:MAG: alpha/beta fold hydrolase [Pseudomonadota bacterium]